MKIKSNFKDYYDFVAHQYGGGDPNIVYARHIVEAKDESPSWPARNYDLPSRFDNRLRRLRRNFEVSRKLDGVETPISWRMLVIMGKPYVAWARELPNHYTNYYSEEDCQEAPWTFLPLGQEIVGPTRYAVKLRMPDVHGFTQGVEDPDLMEITKLVKQPVFEIVLGYYGGSEVLARIPVLKDVNFGSIIEPYTMYQELSMFMGSRMAENPDMMPKSPLSDMEKVDSHGFDRKQSFRHRK